MALRSTLALFVLRRDDREVRLTTPRLRAIANALDAALASDQIDGGERENFERARDWAGEQLRRRHAK